MGKSNRIRNDRANTTLSGIKPHKKKQGMPSWAINLITIVVAVVILASVALSLMTANGVFTRMQTAVKSDHYRVNANMMNYYFTTQYNSFVSENSSYLSYYGLDTSLSLKEQYVNGTDDADGTWFDYMMEQTTSQVEEILVYCEEAYERDIELDDEDKEQIEAELEMYETYASMYGYTTNSYVSAMYGKGMKLKDIRNALELSALASKCSSEVGEELEGAISDADVDTEYASDKLAYDLVDYSSYSFTVTYDDVAKDNEGKTDAEIIAAYKEKIAEAKGRATALALTITDKNAFEDAVTRYIVEDVYDSNYDTAVEDGDVATESLPDDEQTEKIRTALIDYITELIKKDEHLDKANVVVDKKVTGTDFELTSDAYAELIKTIAHDVADAAEEKVKATFSEGASYADTDDALVWAFGDGRKVGDTTTIEEGDGADGAELSANADELKSFTVSAYLLTRAQYRDETLTRNVGIMVFSSADEAAEAIKKLSEGMSIDDFEAVCNELDGSFTDYENYTEDAMGVDDFDAWLYADTTKIGSYTAEAIELDDSQYAVAVYYADGEAEWYVAVKSAIFTEKYEAFDTEVKEKYTVEVKDKVIARIDG